jgi:lipopolysaccharide biosynthesis regulator YciM
MRIRTLLVIAAVLLVVFALAGVTQQNRDLLRQELQLWGDLTLEVGWMLVLCFVAGGGLVFVALSVREAGHVLERWRRRRESRKSREIEDLYSRGLVAVLEGRTDEALQQFRAVLERDSRHFPTLIKLGEVLRDQGKYDQAIEFHRKAEHLREDEPQALYALVEDHEAEGNIERARAVLGRIIAINKNSIAAWRKLRSLHVKQEDWDAAQDAHRKVEKLTPAAPEEADRRVGIGIRYELAMARLRQGKAKEAIGQLRRLSAEHVAFVPAHVGLGQALREAGQDGETVDAWYRGFEATGSPIFLIWLEEHFLERDQPLEGIEALKRCVSHSRKDTLPRFYLGKLYFRLEMLDDAFAMLSALEGRAAYAPTLHYLLGRIHERRRKFEEATREYRKVIKETELVQLDFLCRTCAERRTEWSDRCASCGEWNTVEVNFREEISLEELGISTAPIYTAER